MAKEKEKGGKPAAAEEQLVEKPREPMFSSTGLVVYAGSLVLCAAVVLVVAYVLWSGGGTPTDGAPAPNAAGAMPGDEADILSLEGITAQVPTHGTGTKRIRFKLIIQFDGTPEQRALAMEWVRQKNREALLKQMAGATAAKYDLGQISDTSFPRQFEHDFVNSFNTRFADRKIREAKVWDLDLN